MDSLSFPAVNWQIFVALYGWTYGRLTEAYASNLAGLAFGCLFFIPFALQFGRRPIYLLSTTVVFACTLWGGVTIKYESVISNQVILGLAGAISETIVYMTASWSFSSSKTVLMKADCRYILHARERSCNCLCVTIRPARRE